MRLLIRIVVGLLVLVGVAVGAALIALPRLLDDDSVRQRIEQAARDALGRELRYERLELGFLPPSLRAQRTVISGETPDAAPLLEAEEIGLRVAILPLLFQRVVISSLVVEGATLRLVRTKDGFVLPEPPPRDEAREKAGSKTAPDAPPPAGTADADTKEGGGMALAVRRIRLRDSTLVLSDRSVRPPVEWELREIAAEATGRSLDAPIDLDVDATLGSGGRFVLKGSASQAGELDLDLRLDDVALGPLAPYLGDDLDELAGRLSGTVSVVGQVPDLERLDADLTGSDLRFRRDDLVLRGPVEAQVNLLRPNGAADGTFALDVTDAALEVSGGFTKPPGTRARVTGRITKGDGGGLAFDDVKLLIKNFEATGRVGSLDPVRAEISAAPFELNGWEEIVPSLADLSPTGRLGLSDLRYSAKPASLVGEVRLDDLSLHSADAPPIVLTGLLRATGDRLVSEGLTGRTADQTLALDAELDRLFDAPRYRLALKAKDADANALVSALLAKPDTLYGPLGLDATLRGEAGGSLLDSLSGRIDFSVISGRLVGVSLLRAVTDRLGAAGNLALDLGKALGGRDLQRFYGDEFERLSGVLDIQRGIARTDDLRFVYQGYIASLRGTLALADLALDMTGELTILEEIDQKLARELKLPDAYQPRPRVIELASVRGSLDAPKIRLAEGAAVRMAGAYYADGYGSKLRDQVDEELGSGTGILVEKGLEILKDTLGRGSKAKP